MLNGMYIRFGPASPLTREQQIDLMKQKLSLAPADANWVVIEDNEDAVTRENQERLLQLNAIDTIAVASLDRLDTVLGNMEEFLRFLALLEKNSVRLIVVSDDFDTGTIDSNHFSKVVSMYRGAKKALKREKVKTSLMRAVSKGRPIGRPKKRDDEEIISLMQQGISVREIAKHLGLSHSSVEAALKAHSPS